MKTFEEAADANGLTAARKELYVKYMRERWASEEERMCANGYALQWADRFLEGREYAASDINGQTILNRLENK